MTEPKTYEYVSRKLSAWLALGAFFFALQSASPAHAGLTISKRQAMAYTQARALLECVSELDRLGLTSRWYCKLQPNSWVQERCSVTNPRLPYLLFLGSWGTCPFRWWAKEREGAQRQQLHGCAFRVRRHPATGFKLRGHCLPGTRFPS